ncbi:MAG: histidine kinase [Sterolibacterium sp.]|nr:histidine kinase [Sterolibacterium sp.]
MASIRQSSSLLPDFSNLGVWLRILLITNALAALAVFAGNRQLAEMPGELALLSASVEPPLIASLLLLSALQRLLAQLPYAVGVISVLGVVLACTALWNVFGVAAEALATEPGNLARALFWAGLCAAALLFYFNVRARLQSPALAEARLMALSARIRPHFLFNALNAVLGVIRSDPQRAEAALEELSDLFRVLMRDNRELVRLSDEIALARQYLDLERLRLGDRLQVKWDIESCPPDALMPPLMLQPLLENAVYHGIEPSDQPGEITIGFARRGDQLQIEMSNPFNSGVDRHPGNQMALANIRERLMLFFDLEARLEAKAETDSGRYVVRIVMPYRLGKTA